MVKFSFTMDMVRSLHLLSNTDDLYFMAIIHVYRIYQLHCLHVFLQKKRRCRQFKGKHLQVCLTKKCLYTQMHELSTAVEEFVLNIIDLTTSVNIYHFWDNDVMIFGFALDILCKYALICTWPINITVCVGSKTYQRLCVVPTRLSSIVGCWMKINGSCYKPAHQPYCTFFVV